MNTMEQERESRRAAVLGSLHATDAKEVAARFHRFLDHSGGALNDWDLRFVEFIEQHREFPLWAGDAGRGFEFVFSPRDETGFWMLEARDGVTGKGFLDHHDAGRLFALAEQIGLRAPGR